MRFNTLEVEMTPLQVRRLHSQDPDVQVLLREMQRPWQRIRILKRTPCGKKNTKR